MQTGRYSITEEKESNMTKKIKQSETVEIMRSQIRLNPCNPKRHSDKQVTEQKKNLQRVGFLGGVTWNETTGNLVDGHRRIKALDLINKYDGTPATDYPVKVERVRFDEKQELEQMTFMALGNTKADYQLIAEYLPDIDYSVSGIDEYDLAQIQSFLPDKDVATVYAMDDFITPTADEPNDDAGENGEDEEQEATPEEKKTAVKEAKAAAKEAAVNKWQDLSAYITISFANAEEKLMFCELVGVSEDEMWIQGEKVLDLIQ